MPARPRGERAAFGPLGARRYYLLGRRASGAALLALTLAGALLFLAALAWCLADGFLVPGMALAPPPEVRRDLPRKGRS